MQRVYLFLLTTALGFAFAGAGCATTTASFEELWRAPNLRRGELTNVVILFRSPDGAMSRTAEDKLALELTARGVRATPAYMVLDPESRTDSRAARDLLRGAGFDGIITMRIVDRETKPQYYATFDYFWGDAWGPVVIETIVRIEINAYSLLNNQLVWSGLSKSVDPDSVNELINDVTELVGDELVHAGIVAAGRAP